MECSVTPSTMTLFKKRTRTTLRLGPSGNCPMNVSPLCFPETARPMRGPKRLISQKAAKMTPRSRSRARAIWAATEDRP